ncbi:MAG: hypothetical protein COX90_01640 [Candidatus Nealsonbacteria bacterium CG_4_10_14_0_2_um_filter_38_17]|uniref:Uncharacterized protein n=2 Tax=Candidatus Nealsoniibacteriota TaxID=1817911 RepID=A0A2M7UYQ8_9BACT|nr:MAG: hypothetical protein COX36_03490 [Candidatus Nealsonbacteria bacterium CG23_combo_of_CG06-09_8_20_14_all_38_19]PIZ89005.1 MAG: hypothetical protein COX90_01640 [Candidatus Nealsonbacteria bacterium CG_4_10_14_0_2_um_filter_38_17]
MSEHSLAPDRRKIVEIWNGNTLMGAIYPTNTGIKVVSKYIADNPEGAIEINRSELPPIPAILINLI